MSDHGTTAPLRVAETNAKRLSGLRKADWQFLIYTLLEDAPTQAKRHLHGNVCIVYGFSHRRSRQKQAGTFQCDAGAPGL